MSIPSELGHLAMPANFLVQGKTRWHKRLSNPGPPDPESYALPLRHTGRANFGLNFDVMGILQKQALCYLFNIHLGANILSFFSVAAMRLGVLCEKQPRRKKGNKDLVKKLTVSFLNLDRVLIISGLILIYNSF